MPISLIGVAADASVRQNYQPMKIAPLVGTGLALSDAQKLRYIRQTVIADFSMQGQERLNAARVLCVGAGGLGSPVLLYLAAAGVGNLGVMDFDVVDESNLHRQILFGTRDIGKNKAEVAKEKLTDLNPHIRIQAITSRLDIHNAIEVFSDYDIVVDATDNFATRYLINDAAVLLNKPYVWGSVNQFDGQAAIFWNTHGPCYRCLHPKPPAPETVQNCAEAGVIGALCSTIASLHVNEVIKAITGIGEIQIGKLIIFDALESSFSKLDIRKDLACVMCSAQSTQAALLEDYEEFCGVRNSLEISAQGLQDKFVNGEEFVLIDVREPSEFEQSRIPNSILIPKNQFEDLSALQLLPHDKEIILHCRSGVRSAQCLEIIQAAGFNNSRHLRGGILAWESL